MSWVQNILIKSDKIYTHPGQWEIWCELQASKMYSSYLSNLQYDTVWVLLLTEKSCQLSEQAALRPLSDLLLPTPNHLSPQSHFLCTPRAAASSCKRGRPLQWDPILSHPSLSLWDLTPPCRQRPPVSQFSSPPFLSLALGINLNEALSVFLDPLPPYQPRIWVSSFAPGHATDFPLHLWALKLFRAASFSLQARNMPR